MALIKDLCVMKRAHKNENEDAKIINWPPDVAARIAFYAQSAEAEVV